MSGQPPEGWYPDPYSPSLLRWWDGEGWSDHTREVPEAAPQAPGWTTPGAPGTSPYPAPDWQGAPRRRSTTPWVIGGVAAVLVIALVVVVGVITNGLGSGGQDEPPAAGPSATASSPGGIVQGERLVDQASGLSFALLPKPWRRAETEPGDPWSAGQFRIVQSDYDGDGDGQPDGDYVASVYCGELAERYTYTGASGLRGTATELAQSFLTDTETYPAPNRVSDVKSRAMKIGGHQAWVVTAKLTFPTAAERDWKWRAEETAFLVVDKGSSRPGAMYVSIPDNVKDPSVEDVLKTVRMTP